MSNLIDSISIRQIYKVQMYYLQLAYLAEVIVHRILFTSKILIGLINPSSLEDGTKASTGKSGALASPARLVNHFVK